MTRLHMAGVVPAGTRKLRPCGRTHLRGGRVGDGPVRHGLRAPGQSPPQRQPTYYEIIRPFQLCDFVCILPLVEYRSRIVVEFSYPSFTPTNNCRPAASGPRVGIDQAAGNRYRDGRRHALLGERPLGDCLSAEYAAVQFPCGPSAICCLRC